MTRRWLSCGCANAICLFLALQPLAAAARHLASKEQSVVDGGCGRGGGMRRLTFRRMSWCDTWLCAPSSSRRHSSSPLDGQGGWNGLEVSSRGPVAPGPRPVP